MKRKFLKIAHFTSFLPKRCGIAIYSYALIKITKNKTPYIKHFVVAVDDIKEGYNYPSIVKFHFWDKEEKEYRKAAEFINKSDCDIVDIQHEFGLYGNQVNPQTLGKDDGKNFLIFLKQLKKPAVVTFHMVYKNPPTYHKKIVEEIARKAIKIIVLSKIAYKILLDDYQLDSKKVLIIPHGVPNVPKYSTPFFKEQLGFPKDSIIISSFGLVRPKKGYEYIIEAMAEIIKEYPQALLLIIGDQHPQRPPQYYQYLKKLTEDLNLKKNVKFIKKFLNYSNLLNYLMATNIFVAPYLVEQHVSSGALSYAMACGRACIATPFDYAKEVLRNGRGIIVPFKNSKAITQKIKFLIKHPKARHRIENKAYSYMRKQTWSRTTQAYIDLFQDIKNEK